MKRTQPLYKVTRRCCTSGNCFHCLRVTPYGVSRRILQTSTFDRAHAEKVAHNWRAYDAKIEEER